MKHFSFRRIKNYKGAGIALFREEPDNTFSVLLGKRKHNPSKGKWSFPGGALDTKKDKTFEDTAWREFKEELIVNMSELDKEKIGAYKINLPLFHWKTFLYKTKSYTTITINHEFSKLGWINEEEFLRLPKHLWVKSVYRKYKRYRRKHRE